MFHDHVEETEGCDERTDDGVGRGQGEDQEHPAVVEAEHELVEVRLTHARGLGHRS